MRHRLFLGVALIATTAISLVAAEITLPEETARLIESPLPGYGMATTYCYTCHSTDYVRSQPIVTRATWKATVTKMQKTFGAVIPDDAVEPIAEYLTKTYGTERTNAAPEKGSPPPPAKAEVNSRQ